MLNKPYQAVRIGTASEQGYFKRNPQFVYFYSLVNRNDNTWTIDKGTDNLSGLALSIAANGGVRNHFIQMDEDYPFILHSSRFSAYYNNSGTYEWIENIVKPLDPSFVNIFDPQFIEGISLLHFIKCSFSVHAPDGKYLWGGTNFDSIVRAGDLTPIAVQTLQGEHNGISQTPTPFMIPRSGTVKLQFTNTHATKEISVAGMLFGTKVRV